MRPIHSALALVFAAALHPAAVQAQPLVESFDAGVPAGWVATNNSSPLGATNWFDGNPAVFGPQASTSYIAANFNAAGDGGTVSDWLISPQLTSIQNGQLLTFYTRTETGAPAADRLQVRLCSGDATVCQVVGTLPTDTGNFGTVLLDVNPAYAAGGFPATWTLQSTSVAGLPAGVHQGRIAFRHMAVVSGPGPTATGGDYVGIDSVSLLAALPALSITKSVSNPIPPLASPFTYQIMVTNSGAAAATAVSITDNVPAELTIGTVSITPSGTCSVVAQLVSCSVPVLAAGTSVTVTIPVTASAAGVLTNTASVSAAGITAIQASVSARPGAASTVPSLSLLGLILFGLSTALAALFVLARVR